MSGTVTSDGSGERSQIEDLAQVAHGGYSGTTVVGCCEGTGVDRTTKTKQTINGPAQKKISTFST